MRAVVSVRLHSAPFPCSEPPCTILQLLLLCCLLIISSPASAERRVCSSSTTTVLASATTVAMPRITTHITGHKEPVHSSPPASGCHAGQLTGFDAILESSQVKSIKAHV
jgi:hypothetical protein